MSNVGYDPQGKKRLAYDHAKLAPGAKAASSLILSVVPPQWRFLALVDTLESHIIFFWIYTDDDDDDITSNAIVALCCDDGGLGDVRQYTNVSENTSA